MTRSYLIGLLLFSSSGMAQAAQNVEFIGEVEAYLDGELTLWKAFDTDGPAAIWTRLEDGRARVSISALESTTTPFSDRSWLGSQVVIQFEIPLDATEVVHRFGAAQRKRAVFRFVPRAADYADVFRMSDGELRIVRVTRKSPQSFSLDGRFDGTVTQEGHAPKELSEGRFYVERVVLVEPGARRRPNR